MFLVAFVQLFVDFVEGDRFLDDFSIFGKVEVRGVFESDAFRVNVVQFKKEPAANAPISLAQFPFFRELPTAKNFLRQKPDA